MYRNFRKPILGLDMNLYSNIIIMFELAASDGNRE